MQAATCCRHRPGSSLSKVQSRHLASIAARREVRSAVTHGSAGPYRALQETGDTSGWKGAWWMSFMGETSAKRLARLPQGHRMRPQERQGGEG